MYSHVNPEMRVEIVLMLVDLIKPVLSGPSSACHVARAVGEVCRTIFIAATALRDHEGAMAIFRSVMRVIDDCGSDKYCADCVELFVYALMSPLPTRLHKLQQQSIQSQVQVQQWNSLLVERALISLNGKGSTPSARRGVPVGVSVCLLSALSRVNAYGVKTSSSTGGAGGVIPSSCHALVSPSLDALVETIADLVRSVSDLKTLFILFYTLLSVCRYDL